MYARNIPCIVLIQMIISFLWWIMVDEILIPNECQIWIFEKTKNDGKINSLHIVT